MKTKIIILGGGFAGLRAYYRLNEFAGNLDITVIDKRSQLLEKPSLPEVAFSGKPVASVLIDLQPAVEHKKGRFIHAEVTQINPDQKTVTLHTQEELSFDYLIIASGAVKDYQAIDGLSQYGYSVCDDAHAAELWKALQNFKGGNIVIGTAKSTFGTQVKAPNLAAPCEGPVGEAMFMIDSFLKEKKMRDQSTIHVFSPGKIFFEDVGDHVRNKVGGIMKKHNISLSTDKVVTQITADTVFFEDHDKIPCDLAIVIPPYKALPIFKECGLGDDAGFIPTDTAMKHTTFEGIYAIGDINALAQPKLGHIAVHQADIAVSAIIKEMTGEGQIIKYEPSVFCIMNMGGQEAILIYSDNLYEGDNDLAFHSPMARMMKWSFDSYYYFTQGHMFPDFAVEGMEKFLSLFKEDKDKYIPFE